MKNYKVFAIVGGMIIFFIWSMYVMRYAYTSSTETLIHKVDSLDVRVKVLEHKLQRDTIIVNINLNKQNGN